VRVTGSVFPPEHDAPFPTRILVATDGSEDAERAVEIAARVGHRYGSRIISSASIPGRTATPSASRSTL
jgi:nucleotide-binding universal stress UspA family protein